MDHELDSAMSVARQLSLQDPSRKRTFRIGSFALAADLVAIDMHQDRPEKPADRARHSIAVSIAFKRSISVTTLAKWRTVLAASGDGDQPTKYRWRQKRHPDERHKLLYSHRS